MAFIKLTGTNGGSLYINSSAIEAFFDEGGYTSIIPANSQDYEARYTVKESPEEVIKIIEKDYISF